MPANASSDAADALGDAGFLLVSLSMASQPAAISKADAVTATERFFHISPHIGSTPGALQPAGCGRQVDVIHNPLQVAP